MANEYYIDLDRLTLYDNTLKTYDTTDVKMNGTAAVGTSKKCARADHVHPKDTSKANLASPTFTGTPKAPTAASGTNTTQIATTAFVQSAISGINTGVTGVKGNAESTYRTGQVNLTPANIGAAPNTDFTGATANAAGTHGLVPAPASGDNKDILFGDGNWYKPRLAPLSSTSTEISLFFARDDGTISGESIGTGVSFAGASSTKAGLMVAADKIKLDGLPDNATLSSTYALKSEITGIYKYKGSVASESNLPNSGQVTGDVYNIESDSTYGPAGTNVAWTGTAWDALGGLFTISTATNAQIAALFA